MNGPEIRVWRERLGLDQSWLANHLAVDVEAIEGWEADGTPIPSKVIDEMRYLEAHTLTLLDEAVDMLQTVPEPLLLTFRTDADFQKAHPDADPPFPASWHRALAGRLLEDIPNLTIVYWPDSSAT